MSRSDRLRLVGDTVLAAAFAVALVWEAATATVQGPRWLSVSLSLVMAGSLAFRRWFPLSSYLVVAGALIAQVSWFFVGDLYQFASLVSIYSLGAHGTSHRALLGPPVALAVVAVFFSKEPDEAPLTPVIISVVWILAWLAGYILALRQAETAESRERAVKLAAERDEERQRAAAEERVRIARELHDVVGHAVNVMVVQAGAARQTLDRDAPSAREAVVTIEQTGREALDELDRLLGALRSDRDSAELRPQPGLEDLPSLAARFRDAGLPVELRLKGTQANIPRSVELSSYRIVQEALTNTLKHAGPVQTSVSVDFDGAAIRLEVVDAGSTTTAHVQEGGRGLIGIKERVALFAGTFEAGPRSDGGFAVRCTLPVGPR